MMLRVFLLLFLIIFPVACALCEIFSSCSDDDTEE